MGGGPCSGAPASTIKTSTTGTAGPRTTTSTMTVRSFGAYVEHFKSTNLSVGDEEKMRYRESFCDEICLGNLFTKFIYSQQKIKEVGLIDINLNIF